MSGVVETFLKQEEYADFVLYKKLKVEKPAQLSDFYSPEGEIKIDTTCTHDEYLARLNSYLNQLESLKKKLKSQGSTVITHITALTQEFSNIADTYSQLEAIQGMVPFGDAQCEMYKACSSAFQSLSRHMNEENDFISDYVVKYNEYGTKEVPCMRQIIKLRESHEKALKKLEKSLQSKKEKLWAKGDVSMWELNPDDASLDMPKLSEDKEYAFERMLPADSNVLEKVREIYGFYNYQ